MVSAEIEKRLWAAADQLWANTGLKPSQFSTPVLGLIFLRYAEKRYAEAESRIGAVGSGKRRKISKADYDAEGVIFLRPEARFSHLQSLTESDDIGKAINEAMKAIEEDNPDLSGALPQTYTDLDNEVLVELIRLLAPVELTGDAFGKVYEYFLGNFAMKEGQKGGVFYTPESIVKLIVEIIEPYHGRILDPACGSGGMFVQSANFVERHGQTASREISVYGVEKDRVTVNLNKMNLAVHGLSGDVREANTYATDIKQLFPRVFSESGGFDFVMANPPFNVSGVRKDDLEGDWRFPFGIPKPDNANYLWMQLFYSALNDQGRAGFVMANSAGDARGSEQLIRQHLIEDGGIDVIVSVGPNFFYTVTLPCTLWFFDKSKRGTERQDSVLFLNARSIFRQIDRAHRDFLPEQIELLSNIVRLYRGEAVKAEAGSAELLAEHGLGEGYVDVPGLCKVATRAEIEALGWSLNPGRYVGASTRGGEDVHFVERFEELNENLLQLSAEAAALEQQIADNAALVLEGLR
ncbi:putative type I restriction enzymeP M protein [Pseudooceanicola marinus]|uniref:site-specific DNA-methyltransferase (adenine-specific) n=2 Tax=Pseudooceanicola marinus TaxID=396013 RepID=A0A1X7ABF5_9RHOB|nr:class I SAM-dependent DNA methyltransferase [Pseudooceanicola marinus]PJE33763.1 SAM-dependent DNA methyltransferase [Pseudooceanicola marinus]SLN75104.1 putative type I restriction enzymeP M protein [Pseudooceanicola marinus]